MGLAAAERGLKSDDRIAIDAGEPLRRRRQHAPQALGDVGDLKELGRRSVGGGDAAAKLVAQMGSRAPSSAFSTLATCCTQRQTVRCLSVAGDQTSGSSTCGVSAALPCRFLNTPDSPGGRAAALVGDRRSQAWPP